MTEEHEIQKKIQVAVSQRNCTIFRANVGKIFLNDGGYFDTGLPKGFPIYLVSDGVTITFFLLRLRVKQVSRQKNKLYFMNFYSHIKLFTGWHVAKKTPY